MDGSRGHARYSGFSHVVRTAALRLIEVDVVESAFARVAPHWPIGVEVELPLCVRMVETEHVTDLVGDRRLP